MHRTFIMLKPDCVERHLCGEIITRFEHRGLNIVAIKKMKLSDEFAAIHYAAHKEKSFYQELVDFITSGPVVAMVLEGKNAVDVSRLIMGPAKDATPGTIRGDYATSVNCNIVHGSDSVESAEQEISKFFTEDEII